MISIKNKHLNLSVQVLLGSLFVFSGIAKLFPIHLTELNLVYHHIASWNLSPYLARALVILEILIGLALIFGVSLKRLTINIALFFTLIFSLYLIALLLFDGNDQNCGCFGSILPMTPIESLIKNVVITVLLILLKRSTSLGNSKGRLFTYFSLSVSSIIFVIYYFPIYTWLNIAPLNGKLVPFDFNSPIKFDNQANIDLKKDKKLIAVFNMACDNCRELAFKLGILSKQRQFDNLYLLLVGDQEDVKDFLNETHLNYPYKRYTFFEFVKLYPHSTWPWIILSEDGEIKKQWIYETFDVKNFTQQLN
jgi:uncharacterized membrane protein YphA (DoxX/SURF4 family)